MTLGAGKLTRHIESVWRDGGTKERQATEPELLRFIEQYFADPKCVSMRLRLAWLRVEQRRLAEAITIVATQRPFANGVDADWISLLEGAILRAQGQSAKALERLLPMEGKTVDPTLRELWSIEAVKAALDVSRFETAVVLMVGFRAHGREEYVVTTQSQIESWLIRLPEDELSRQLAKLTVQAARPVVDEGLRQARVFLLETIRDQLALAALSRKDATLARQLLNLGSPRFNRSETGEQLRKLSDLAEPPVQSLQAAVGILLEMQDEFASRRSAEIITGALRALDENHSTPPVRLMSREIREVTDSAIEAGLSALVQDGAAIIIAGVTSVTARAAARLAVSRQAVVITLSGESTDGIDAAQLFRIEEVTEVIKKSFVEAGPGGLLRLTMQDAVCASKQPVDGWQAAYSTRREILLLTDEDCAKKVASELSSSKSNAKVWLGPEAVGAFDRFSDVTLLTSPRLVESPSTAKVQQWRERFRRFPFWYEALGYDVVQLSTLAMRATALASVTSTAAIARKKEEIARALGRVQATLLTSSSPGFDRKQRLVPTVSRVTAKNEVKEKSGP